MHMRRAIVTILIASFALAGAACKLKEDETTRVTESDGPPPIPAPRDVAGPPPNALRTPSGLASIVLIVGLGSIHPKPENEVTVHYTGWTADGKMFDSSFRYGKPATFRLTEVIPGWTEALQLMVVKEKRRFWIPGHLAYDASPDPTSPKGTLCFEIELLDIR